MRKLLIGLIMGMLVGGTAFAVVLPEPPELKESPVALQHYLKDIRRLFYILDVVTTTPDGNRNGKKGELVIFNDSGTFKLFVNTTSLKVWQQL